MKLFWLGLVTSTYVLAAEPSHVLVQGSCNIKVTPDRGSISFTAENQSKNQQEAVKKTNDQINLLKKQISDLKLADLDLKNTNYSVFPVRDYEKDKYVEKGTKASLTLEVSTSDITKIGETLVLATKVGIAQVGSLTTFLSPEKTQAEYLKCLDIAAQDAKEKAHQLGRKLGFKVGEVISVNEVPESMQRPQPMMMRAMNKGMMDAESTNIEAGSQQFSANIQVSFSIK